MSLQIVQVSVYKVVSLVLYFDDNSLQLGDMDT